MTIFMSLITGLSSMLALGMLTPIQSIVCMIIVFAGTAVYLYSSGFVLMGLLYILIYVGAIAILFLFIISLLNIKYTPTPHTISPFAITILVLILIPLDLTYDTVYITELATGWQGELVSAGSLIYTEYAIPTLLLGIGLILSIVGAIAITR